MNKFLTIATIAVTMLTTIIPADARLGVGPGQRGVGVGRPGAYGVGGWGRVGRPVARPYIRATPFRPFVGPVVR